MNKQMQHYTYSGLIETLNDNEILVFGSNPQGWHGRGLAKIAHDKFGAIMGQGRGLQGKSYGLVTKNMQQNYKEKVGDDIIIYDRVGRRSVSKPQITSNIKELYDFAQKHSTMKFFIGYTRGGSNLNGYSDVEMAVMFGKAGPMPHNIIMEDKFYDLYRTYNHRTN